MGIAAFFDIPDLERVLTLCRRMGVRWMRSTEDADKTDYAEHGMVGIRGFHLPNNATNELQRREFAREKLLDAKARNCRTPLKNFVECAATSRGLKHSTTCDTNSALTRIWI